MAVGVAESLPSDELYLAILQGPQASGKSTVANGLQKVGFSTIGLGDFYRKIDSLYLDTYPDQVEQFCPEQFDAFMAEPADAVQAVMRGLLPAPHGDLKHPDIQATISKVGEAETSQITVNDYAVELLETMRGLVFMEGRALDQIMRERTAAGAFTGRIIANFYVDVSDTVAAERNILEAEDKGAVLDATLALALVRERNQRDRTRAINPMQLPREHYVVNSAVNHLVSRKLGYRAVCVSQLRRDPIPICVRINTDRLLPSEVQHISQNVAFGDLQAAVPRLANQPVSGTL